VGLEIRQPALRTSVLSHNRYFLPTCATTVSQA
jgi:hypothetical protein